MSTFKIEMSESEMRTRGSFFDSIMENVFDAALLVDKKGLVLHAANGSSPLRSLTKEESIGKPFREINPNSDLLLNVLKTEKAMLGVIDVVQGRKCLVNIYPITDNGNLIGALATILYSNLSALKQLVASIKETNPNDASDTYNVVARIGTSLTFYDYVGISHATTELVARCRRAALSNRPILLMGESGTGKEILASAIHSESSHGTWKPFIKINCSAIPKDLLESELFGHEKGSFTGAIATKKGKFELASGGSILLDEIGDMDYSLQSKLLRVLEEKEFERVGGNKMIPLTARILASTNINLREKCAQKTFRSDLYYRLSAIEIKVPPLRERKEDIPLLIENIMNRDQLNFKLEPEALELLCKYNWPGNVRELRNIINRIGVFNESSVVPVEEIHICLDDSIDFEESHRIINKPSPIYKVINSKDFEKQHFIDALQECNYNVAKVSKKLGICRATVYNRMKKYSLEQ